MLGFVVLGSRTWMCTIAAPALAASIEDCAICSALTGTAGFLPGVSADPVTAQEIMTLRRIAGPPPSLQVELYAIFLCKPRPIRARWAAGGLGTLPLATLCALR